MSTVLTSTKLSLTPQDNRRLADLCGQYDEHLRQIEKYFDVKIHHRHHAFQITGDSKNIETARQLIQSLYEQTQHEEPLTPAKIHLLLRDSSPSQTPLKQDKKAMKEAIVIHTKRGAIKGHGKNQEQYLLNIAHHDINFSIGPAGTGKTYLAVASAVDALQKEQVQRILLVRPAVEAGEKLGFLPGDLAQKINPYLRPLYDALYEMLGFEQVSKFIEKDIIEIAPLAYMRGRTLNDAFVILDEAQNTTVEQMQMFLTRIGFGTKAIITGDVTQVDLPKHVNSGLLHATKILKNIEGISFTHFTAKDAVRHPLVQSIIEAYQKGSKTNDR